MPYVQLSNLDFADIKTALKEYLRSQGEFTDFDFEGSNIQSIADRNARFGATLTNYYTIRRFFWQKRGLNG